MEGTLERYIKDSESLVRGTFTRSQTQTAFTYDRPLLSKYDLPRPFRRADY